MLFRTLDRRRVAAAVLGVFAAWLLFSSVLAARTTTERLGLHVEVLVAEVPIPAGTEITASMVARRGWPAGLLPATSPADAAVGRVTSSAIVAGEVIIEDRLFAADARIGPGQRLVTLPMPLTAPLLSVGTSVELVGLLPPDGPFPSTAVLVASGVVSDLSDDSVSVAVSADRVLPVVEYMTLGVIELIAVPS